MLLFFCRRALLLFVLIDAERRVLLARQAIAISVSNELYKLDMFIIAWSSNSVH